MRARLILAAALENIFAIPSASVIILGDPSKMLVRLEEISFILAAPV